MQASDVSAHSSGRKVIADDSSQIPRLSFSWKTKKLNIALAWAVILAFDLIGPVLLYYLLTDHTDLEEEDVLGIALAALGLGEILEFPWRTYLLLRHRTRYAPLNDLGGKWYHFDIIWWFYIIATTVATVPFAVSSSVSPIQHEVYLMSFAILLGFCGSLGLLSLVPFRLPVRISSDARGTQIKPAAYYVTEDFMAVDAGQGRNYREQLRARYNASQIFRDLMWWQTFFFSALCISYVGLSAAITWTVPFRQGFGLIFGLLFACIILACFVSYGMCRWMLHRESCKWQGLKEVDGQV